MNRESWLNEAVELLWPVLEAAGTGTYACPVRVSVGFSSRAPGKTAGQCHYGAEDGVPQLFISPVMAAPARVLGVLAHEMIHASDRGKSKHSGYFRRTALGIGLLPPMTATQEGPEFLTKMVSIVEGLGDYPHITLPFSGKRGAVGSRLLKLVCSDPLCECGGYTVRGTKKWLDVGFPCCPFGASMHPEEGI